MIAEKAADMIREDVGRGFTVTGSEIALLSGRGRV